MFALLSVFNKTGIVDLASGLIRSGHSIIATGKTFSVLRDAGISAVDVSSVTKFPEILGGRVKTLHPQIFGGILCNRSDESHQRESVAYGLPDIRVVVANLYPFWELNADVTDATAVELIDIGGVSLIRAAAKNFKDITVLTDPSQYEDYLSKGADLIQRRTYARGAFETTAKYDTNIANYFSGVPTPVASVVSAGGSTTETITRKYTLVAPLKYGCNPHQTPAGVYSIDGQESPLKLLHGNWSYINVLDAMNAWGLVFELGLQFPGCVSAASFKHTSPAGAAVQMYWDELSPQTQQMLSIVYVFNDESFFAPLTHHLSFQVRFIRDDINGGPHICSSAKCRSSVIIWGFYRVQRGCG
jgi:phosphoribosylaminoimidazolecarboxamide formyltransferase/IMP cyclohydrolase